MKITAPAGDDETPAPVVEEEPNMPKHGTLEWIQYWSEVEGLLPSPINVSITGSTPYLCPELRWYNFDLIPHKIKMTNTGYTVLIGAKWKTERPYLEGGPFLEKHVLSQIHFHWGTDMMEGSDHTVDKIRYPGEMQVTFFRSEYLTQDEAFKHSDGVVMICYLIKYGVIDDEKLAWIIEGFPRIREAQTHTRIGPRSMARLLPMFYEDYFLYWGKLDTQKGDSYVVRWLVSRKSFYASFDQMKQFRKLWDPWDEPLKRNYRPLQERGDRHVFFICPHWCQYNSLLPMPRVPEESISIISPAYEVNPWMLGPRNRSINIAKQIVRFTSTQSPIAIVHDSCLKWTSSHPLKLKGYWDVDASGVLVNTGTTAQFRFESIKPTVSGGPLIGVYEFLQVHFHWGLDNFSGSEHTINGQRYAGETHFVHLNRKYGSLNEAINHPDGLAVVGFFFDTVDEPNLKLEKLVEGFRVIKKCGQSVKLVTGVLAWINSEDLQQGSFYAYRGSLTTPPYAECLTWTVFEKPIQIGKEQISALREIEGRDYNIIKCNARPIQTPPQGHRIVYVTQAEAKP